MSAPVDLLAVMDHDKEYLLAFAMKDELDDHNNARAAVAELMEREAKQRDVLERLCEAYIANRHAMGVHDFVKCVTPAGNRCADSETGRLWLEAAAVARCGVVK